MITQEPEDEDYAYMYGYDIAVAQRHRILRECLNDIGAVDVEELVRRMAQRGLTVDRETIEHDLAVFQQQQRSAVPDITP